MKYKQEQIKEVLNHNCFKKYDYYDGTFGEFLADCLKALWEEGECFDGRRPICDSGWENIAGEALALLEPKIGKVHYESSDEGNFEVLNHKLYLKTFDIVIDYIFKNK